MARVVHDFKIEYIDGTEIQYKLIYFAVIQLVASADCAGALDVTDDLQHLLVSSHHYFKSCFFDNYGLLLVLIIFFLTI